MYRLFFYFLVFYLIYRGILFFVRLFSEMNKKNVNGPVAPDSKFKDVEEAHFTEIKDDKNKDSH
jgi:hypothetical protein